jgi:hypothetical protein
LLQNRQLLQAQEPAREPDQEQARQQEPEQQRALQVRERLPV